MQGTQNDYGELTLGGVDSSKYTGTIGYTPKIGDYWGVTVNSISFGSTFLMGISSAVIDTATTLIYLPDTAYNNFVIASGGSTDSSTSFVTYSTMPTCVCSVSYVLCLH